MVTITTGLDRFVSDEAERIAIHQTGSPGGYSQFGSGTEPSKFPRVKLGYHPFPKQRDFHFSRAKYRLFGGAAGPGKSKALLMDAVLQANKVPGANTLLLRRTFSELEQSLLLYFRRDIPRELYKSYNESKHVVTWWNDSTTRFGYCQSEADVYQYQGAEFFLSESTSLPSLPSASGSSSRHVIGVPCRARFRAWLVLPTPVTSGMPG